MSASGRIIQCHVDESGGMAELAAAQDLLAAAYGPGSWVTAEEASAPTPDERVWAALRAYWGGDSFHVLKPAEFEHMRAALDAAMGRQS